MNKIIKPRQTGKTTELVKISAEKKVPILTHSLASKRMIEYLACELELEIPTPICVRHQYENCVLRKEIESVLVDDCDVVLGMLLEDMCSIGSIDTIAISSTDMAPILQTSKKCRKTDSAKTRRVEVRLTEDEYRMVLEKANQNGTTMTEVIVSSLFN